MTRDQLLAEFTRRAKQEGFDLQHVPPMVSNGQRWFCLVRPNPKPRRKPPEYAGDKWDSWKEVEK